MNYQNLWLCKGLAFPERHLNESIAHYKYCRRKYKEQNTFKMIL